MSSRDQAIEAGRQTVRTSGIGKTVVGAGWLWSDVDGLLGRVLDAARAAGHIVWADELTDEQRQALFVAGWRKDEP